MKKRDEEIKKLEGRIGALEEQINRQDYEINEAEQYSRKTSVRIRGLQVSDKNDVTNSVMNLFKNSLNLNFRYEDIVAAHPLPMKGRPPGGNHPAPPPTILVKF